MVVSSTGILERVELMHSTDSFPPVSQYKLEKEWNYRLVSKVERGTEVISNISPLYLSIYKYSCGDSGHEWCSPEMIKF